MSTISKLEELHINLDSFADDLAKRIANLLNQSNTILNLSNLPGNCPSKLALLRIDHLDKIKKRLNELNALVPLFEKEFDNIAESK